MDIFTWSIPFVVDKINSMLMLILKMGDDANQEEEIELNADEIKKINNYVNPQGQKQNQEIPKSNII